MAESVVSFAVETIGQLLSNELQFLTGVKDQVEQLQLELRQMLSFLKDADARQHNEERVKEWVSQARDLAYEADDLVERYAFKVASRRSIPDRCVHILSDCYATHKIGTQIQMLRTKISDLTNRLDKYGIARDVARRESTESDGLSRKELMIRRTYSGVAHQEDHFVGLGSDVELLVEKLVTDEHFNVVSISGMGGLGKTTLARKVYHHFNVKRYFDDQVWVCISQNWQKKDILQQILIKLIPEKRDDILKWRDEELIRELSKIQQNKKYLLVLDDIWSINAWESIKQAFPIRKDGSKILVTTRNKEVGLQIGPNGFHYEPRLLSVEESWELLRMKALSERRVEDPEETQKFEKLGKEIAKASGGLPLGVIVLGGILATKKSFKEWEMVHHNVKVYLEKGNNLLQEQGNVPKILALSYNDLPVKLKPCFLYLSRFSEDLDIEVETLYQLWIAEGLISMKDRIDNRETMMDVAERYLGELVQRCMVQAKSPKTSFLLRCFESCHLHDLMRDLCVLKAKEENFSLSLINDDNDTCSSSLTDLLQVYRLSMAILPSACNTPKCFVPLEKKKTRHLRSLHLSFLDDYEERLAGRLAKTLKSRINELKMLRVLAIQGFDLGKPEPEHPGISYTTVMDRWKLAKAIGKLVHLRYLSLRDSFIPCLPSSIGNLLHLQTLDLQYAINLIRIPNVLWKLKQLRYLYLPLAYGEIMDEVPELNPFCRLRLKGLNKLEVLENFRISIGHTKDISKLKNLRAFSAIINMDFEEEDPAKLIGEITSSNSDEHLLHRATLAIFSDYRIATTAEKLTSAVGQCFSGYNFRMLLVKGPINNLPKCESGQFFCSALTHLRLESSELTEDPMMGTLEMLPHLLSLELFWCFEGKEMRCTASGFCQLKFLYLQYLSKLEQWWVDEGAMPNLSSLTISDCKQLKMIPNGLRSVTTLQELEIIQMPEAFTNRIQVVDGQEGEDLYKVSHIPSIIIN